MKHPFTIRARHVPVVQRLVKRACAVKHPSGVRHLRDVPRVQRLIERFCVMEHLGHIRHFGHVPLIEWLVKFGGKLEHRAHLGYVRYVPIVQRFVEEVRVFKKSRHIGYPRRVPTANVPVLRFGRRSVNEPLPHCNAQGAVVTRLERHIVQHQKRCGVVVALCCFCLCGRLCCAGVR